MVELANRTTDFIFDLPPETLITALLLALVIAIATSLAYRWTTSTRASSLTPLVCLVLMANLASVAVTVYLVQSKVPTVRIVSAVGRSGYTRTVNVYDNFSPPDSRN